MNQDEVSQINAFSNFFSYKLTWEFRQFLSCSSKKILWITGNQYGKTTGMVMGYIYRILGLHPIPEKNVVFWECKNGHKVAPYKYIPESRCELCGEELKIHERHSRVIRLCSAVKPGESQNASARGDISLETKNTLYPAFKRWLPTFLLKKDITARNSSQVILDPYGGPDIILEYVSYSQEVQDTAGVQRMSIGFDEAPPQDFYEEQGPRLLMEDGDMVFAYTPADRTCFDEETEIITKRGWKKYNEILMHDELLSYNVDKDCYEWSDIKGFYLKEYKGKMIHIKNKRFDFLVTPEHKWVVCNDRRKNKRYLEKSINLNSKHIIKRASSFKEIKEDNLNFSDELIALAGWTVTDGTVFKEGNSCKISITQSRSANEKHCLEIEKLLSHFSPENYSTAIYDYRPRVINGKVWDGEGQVQVFHVYRDLRKDLLKVLDGKSIKQEWLCSLSVRQLNILYEAMVDGDGHRKKKGAVEFKQVNNEKLIDAFHLVCILTGRFSDKRKRKYTLEKEQLGINVFAIGERYESNSHVKSCKINKEYEYSGKIWCPTTKNGTVVVRRKGHVSISGNSWLFDELYDRAKIYYRTPIICKYLNSPEPIIKTDSPYDISVFQAATDDNPTLSKDIVEAQFKDVSDPDTIAIRRYGIFKQLSGRIFKDFNHQIHIISADKWFPAGIPKEWIHGRGIDFHPQTPWAIGFASLSPTNEMFIWKAWSMSPEKYTTKEIMYNVAINGGDYKFRLSLVDPLAAATQKDKVTVLQDMITVTDGLYRERIGTGGGWQTWDTKGDRGRDNIKERLKNSLEVKTPFNNKVNGVYIPTLWILNTCPEAYKSMYSWRWEEFSDARSQVTKEKKNKPEQKYSHMNMVMEALCKEPAFRPRREEYSTSNNSRNAFGYFNNQRGV